jgi:hypothetical protein
MFEQITEAIAGPAVVIGIIILVIAILGILLHERT